MDEKKQKDSSGNTGSDDALKTSPKAKLDTSSNGNRLTPSEIAQLRKDMAESAEQIRKILRESEK